MAMCVAGSAVAGLSAPGASLGSGSIGCDPSAGFGVGKIGGTSVLVFCGPAKGTIAYGGKTYAFKGGNCQKAAGGWYVNIGTATTEATYDPSVKPKALYFNVAIAKPRGDATYKNEAVVQWQIPGKGFRVHPNTVTIAAKGKKGSFSGQLFAGGKGSAKGSWTC